MKKLAERIERVPLAWPMALLMAGAVAFLIFAIPDPIVRRLLGASGAAGLVPAAGPIGALARTLLGAIFAGAAGGAVWLLFHMLDAPQATRRRAATAAPADADPAADAAEIDLFAPAATPAAPTAAAPAPVPTPAPAPAPQLRRADAHPDAPARRPLFAASDLGAPLDEQPSSTSLRARLFGAPAPAEEVAVPAEAPTPVETVSAKPAEPAAPVEAAQLPEAAEPDDALLLELENIVEADDATTHADADMTPAPVATIDVVADRDLASPFEQAPEQVPEPKVTLISEPAPVAEAPAAQPAPEVKPFDDESLAGLMERLERGLAARGGMPDSAAPTEAPLDAAGTLRQALAELRWMTTRR